jgi:hemerythrin superfamily protein
MASHEDLRPPAVRDAVDLLLAQHARIEELFGQVMRSEGETRRVLFAELVWLLTVHEAAEEAVVHPLARDRIDEGTSVVRARLTEERAAKELLAELDEIDPDSPEFGRGLVTLRDIVVMHAKKEERYEFAHLRHTTDLQTRRRLADAVWAAERAAPARPHPAAR